MGIVLCLVFVFYLIICLYIYMYVCMYVCMYVHLFAESRSVENFLNPTKDIHHVYDDARGSLRQGQPVPQQYACS
jgi:hypothetical protein